MVEPIQLAKCTHNILNRKIRYGVGVVLHNEGMWSVGVANVPEAP